MKEEQFLNDLNKCKGSVFQTGEIVLICKVRNNKRNWVITEKEKKKICPYCHTNLNLIKNEVEVLFNKPMESLTIFQAGLLFFMYSQRHIKPIDYANYHKFIAGKEFINSIIEVKGGLD